ncbi:DUF11 domain-containing protein [Aureibaculum sp. A20]|uniref:DUF11 domain-containing protein n=1 Tax=Aureibaculum flavum TaxID=2795986 RepID=A0ABS0WWG7_9FLAO|nr:CshA/CshB family fibrillar adhesin-related protein [Aureibaculum flavum]MBJ2176193.1 DUF11 domain-containing protein [Aureibaculum flavum]
MINKVSLSLITFFVICSTYIVSAQETYLDNFNVTSYSNNNGTQNFSSGWVETGDLVLGPILGNILIASNQLRFTGVVLSSYIRRNLNLNGVNTAILTLDYNATSRGGETMDVELWNKTTNSWDVVYTINTDAVGSMSYILNEDQISNLSAIRFISRSGAWGLFDRIYIDNVKFETSIDTDGDGAPEKVDIDDDNDGILDVIENSYSGTLSETFNYSSHYADGEDPTLTTSAEKGVIFNFNRVITSGVALNDGNIASSSPFSGVSNYWILSQNNNASIDNTTATISFSVPLMASFTLLDVDADVSLWIDKVIVNGYVNGNLITLTSSNFTLNSSFTKYNGSNEFEGVASTDDFGNVIINFPSLVDKIEIIYSDDVTPSGPQKLGISPIRYAPPLDTDNDGKPNSVDLDSDDDGIPDNIEGQTTWWYLTPSGVDVDGNGLDDIYELIPGSGEGIAPYNSDATDTPDYIDLDSDNDVISDTMESGIVLANNDGDGDGLDDTMDATIGYDDPGGTIDNPMSGGYLMWDSDGDAARGGDVNYRDPGDDRLDSDGDGILDDIDVDDDNDGIPDSEENENCFGGKASGSEFIEDFGTGSRTTTPYTNYIYEPNDEPTGSVNDGEYAILNDISVTATWASTVWVNKSDHTGDANGRMALFNSTNSALEEFYNRNNITVTPNLIQEFSFWVLNLDLASTANDRVLPIITAYIQDNAGATTLFTFSTGQVTKDEQWHNYKFKFNPGANSQIRMVMINNAAGGLGNDLAIDDIEINILCDTDGDGIINSLDLDSDNDGILDVVEGGGVAAGSVDANNDGRIDGVPADFGDNGLFDGIEDNDTSDASLTHTIGESTDDTDTIPNYLDLDSDGDGIPDNVEAQTTSGYTVPSGTVDANGVFTNYTTGFDPVNTDGTDNPDYLDADSDNEGGNDTAEVGITLANADADDDGLDDATDTSTGYADPNGTINNPSLLPNTQDNTTPEVDYRDDVVVDPCGTVDTDGDSINDGCDLDDDNDGILDTDECPSVVGSVDSGNNTTNITGFYEANGNNILGFTINPEYPSVVLSSTSGVQIRWDQGTTDAITTVDLILDAPASGTLESVILGNGAEGVTVGTQNAYKEITLTWSGGGTAILNDPLDEVTGRVTGDVLNSGDIIEINNGVPYSLRDTEWNVEVDMSGVITFPTTVSFYADSNINGSPTYNREGFAFTPVIGCPDTDGDGIPNSLDLDSDNDGCPDALEGDPNFNYSDLETDTSLGDTVDTDNTSSTYGVPIVAGSSTVGSSEDATTQAVECDPCNNASTLFVDSDGDTFGDTCDLDDDNDGVLDSEELRCNMPTVANSTSGSGAFQDQVYLFDFSGSDFSDGLDNGDTMQFTVHSNLIVTVTVSDIVNQASASTMRPKDYVSWSGNQFQQLYNTPGSSEALHFIDLPDTVEFKLTAIAVDALGNSVSLDLIGIDAEATIDTDEALSATTNGAVWESIENLGSPDITEEGTATVNFINSVNGTRVLVSNNASEITYSVSSSLSGDQAVGLGIYLRCDTDLDGVYNHLDLDSDNDGCPDALEGTATNAQIGYDELDTDTSIGGAIDGDGIPISAGSGQGNGTSQDGTIQADECSPCNVNNPDFVDTDGDLVGDLCDLDDDNDGIEDCIESADQVNDSFAWTLNAPPGNLTMDAVYDTKITDWVISSTTDMVLNTGIFSVSGSNVHIIGMTSVSFEEALTNQDFVEVSFTTSSEAHSIVLQNVLTGWYQPSQGDSYYSAAMVSIGATNEWATLAKDVFHTYNGSGGIYQQFDHLTASSINLLPSTEYKFRFYAYGQIDDSPQNYSIFDDVNFSLRACQESDSDNDNIPDHLDLDSDNDGIPDNVEAQTTLGYIAPNADSPAAYATNDGLNSAYLPTNGLTPVDTDSSAPSPDGIPDYLDLDSDNEGANDTLEARINLSGNDTDNDGLDDATDATTDYSDPGGTIDNPLSGSVVLFDADNDANTGGDVDFRDDNTICTETAGIIINEKSNGDGGSQDWVELLVVGDAANPTAPVDLTGWFIDDNNGDFEGSVSSGVAQGSLVLGSVFNAVTPGSIIVIYNQSDRDSAIPVDDPTDSNGDGVYILPGNHASLSGCSNSPTTSNSNYLPCTPVSASWSRVAFRNTGDAVQTRRPDGTFYHGYSTGDVGAPFPYFPCGGQSFNLGSGGVGSTFAFQCGDWEEATNFVRSDESGRTPGSVNSLENQFFISKVLNGTLDYSNLNNTNNCTGADLSLKKSVNNSTPNVGDDISFRIIITNNGPSSTSLIEVQDVLPSDFTYTHIPANYSASEGTVTFDTVSRTMTWDTGGYVLSSGSSMTLFYTVTVDVCGEFKNRAEITNSSAIDLDSTTNNGQ